MSSLNSLTNPELVDLLHKVTQELQRRLGKVEVGYAVPTPVKFTKRDKAIQLAKESIESLKDRAGYYPLKHRSCNVQFHINRKKRTVIALLRGFETNRIYEKGISKCDPGDVFNEYIGKAIALHRALGKDVPALLLESPKPETIEIGDILKWDTTHKDSTYKVIDKRSHGYGEFEYLFKSLSSDWQGWSDYTTDTIIDKVIDDTRN